VEGSPRGRGRRIVGRALFVVWALLGGAGCYVGGSRAVDPRDFTAARGWVRSRDFAWVPQKHEDDCGAAALAMVLGAFDVPLSRDEVAAASPPQEGGIRAGSLRDIARGAGLASYVVSGRLHDLEAELGLGHPILVGLGKPLVGKRAALHYEVVAGLQRGTHAILTADPAAGWRAFTWDDFAREWATTGAVTVVVFPRQKI